MAHDVPILFCIFNRPEVTRRVFEQIAAQQPKQLFVVADGPRDHVESDLENVYLTRAIIDKVDWPCNVQCNYAKTNMGCRDRMATGIDWAFRQSEELIILEDDCLPHESFFEYCQELLERYRHDEQVMMISGDNFQPQRRTDQSYYFSRWPHIWGWASWRRAWRHFDIEMRDWESFRGNLEFAQQFHSTAEYEYWRDIFNGLAAGHIDTWDFAWTFACWKRKGLTILPETNLISNLGFDANATHTTEPNSELANLPASAIETPLVHPTSIERNTEADQWTFQNIFLPEIKRHQTQKQQVLESRRPSLWKRLFGSRKAA